jgi:hypothetical protein
MTSRHFVVTGILIDSGNANVDRIVRINTNARIFEQYFNG